MPDTAPKSLDQINQFKFYDLNKRGWYFTTDQSLNNDNVEIAKNIAKDFSYASNRPLNDVEQIFNGVVVSRPTEPILMLYTLKDDNGVYYYFTDETSETYRTLSQQ